MYHISRKYRGMLHFVYKLVFDYRDRAIHSNIYAYVFNVHTLMYFISARLSCAYTEQSNRNVEHQKEI